MESQVVENKANKIWQDYLDGVKYQRQMRFTEEFPKFVAFKEGDQWARVTENTKNFPRPVFNFTEMFIKAKRAAVVNQPLSLVFSPLEIYGNEELNDMANEGAQAYSSYAKILWENLDQDMLNSEMIDDALTVGTGIVHYYWDDDITGGKEIKFKGELRGETIDALSFFVENPQERNIQKQGWIILQSRKTVDAVRELAKKNKVNEKLIELIGADNDESGTYDTEVNEMKTNSKVTVLIRYYKKNGEIYYSISTKNVMIVDDKPLTPRVEGEENTFKITLYPVEAVSARIRKRCIYGIGEAKDIITINKLYNQLKAMQSLNAIQCGNPVLLVKPNALKQRFSNAGGQIVTDYYQGGGDGIKYMQPPSFSSVFSQISEEIFNMARTTSGVTDISTGEMTGSNIAASAIIAMQNQAKTPIKELQSRFYNSMKAIGDIWCQFFKAYYTITRNMTIEDEEGNTETKEFLGSKYSEIDFRLKIQVGVASDSESLSVNMLDAMRARNDITKEQYVDLMSDRAMPFKSDLKTMWKKQEESDLVKAMQIVQQQQKIIEQLSAQNEQNKATAMQLTQQLKSDIDTIDSLSNEDKQLEREGKRVSIEKERAAMAQQMMGGASDEMQGM